MQKLLANRSKQFKGTNEITEQRKLDQSISIRKFEERVIRSEQRFQQAGGLTDAPNAETALAHFDHYCAMVSSTDPETVIKAIVGIRFAVSSKATLPLATLEESGALSTICQMFKDNNAPVNVIYECSWILTNVASGASRFTQMIVREDVAPRCLELLRNRRAANYSIELVEQLIWLLGNISGDNPKYNHMLVDQGMLETLIDITHPIVDYYIQNQEVPPELIPQTGTNANQPQAASFLATCTFCLGNIFRSSPFPPIEKCRNVISELIRIMDCGVKEASEALWAVCHAVEDLEFLRAFLDEGLSDKLQIFIEKLGNSTSAGTIRQIEPPEFALPTIRTIGQIASQDILDLPKVNDILLHFVNSCKLLDVCGKLLGFPKVAIVKESLWVLSNIAASDNKKLAAEILRSNICYHVVRLMTHTKKLPIKRETAWVMQNLMIQKKPIVMKYFLDINFLDGIKCLLEEPTLKALGMDMLHRLMSFWDDAVVSMPSYMIDSTLRGYLEEIDEDFFDTEVSRSQFLSVTQKIYNQETFAYDDDFDGNLDNIEGIEGGL